MKGLDISPYFLEKLVLTMGTTLDFPKINPWQQRTGKIRIAQVPTAQCQADDFLHRRIPYTFLFVR